LFDGFLIDYFPILFLAGASVSLVPVIFRHLAYIPQLPSVSQRLPPKKSITN